MTDDQFEREFFEAAARKIKERRSRTNPQPGEIERVGYEPCPTCKQYSHSLGEDQVAKAFLHFHAMIAHPVRGHAMDDVFDAQTQDAAQVLTAEITRLREQVAAKDADENEAYEIGKREGYEQAVQEIDLLTGGDGEYRYCTDHDPEHHCPDAASMKRNIADRFAALTSSTDADHKCPVRAEGGE